jgi:type II secretory pathway pseudopilin PulG
MAIGIGRPGFPKMNSFRIRSVGKKQRGGFSLVEATFSIGLLSFGFLTLAPLLALGLKTARHARDDRATAQIAQTLIEDAKQGTLTWTFRALPSIPPIPPKWRPTPRRARL